MVLTLTYCSSVSFSFVNVAFASYFYREISWYATFYINSLRGIIFQLKQKPKII